MEQNPPVATAAIEVENLRLCLNGKEILSDLSFSIPTGASMAVIGRNGAGKSSLLKCLAGVRHDYDGSIAIAGHDQRRLAARERARRLAYVPQSPADSAFAFTVGDFVWTGRFPHLSSFSTPSQVDREAVDQAMATAEVENLTARSMDTLSGGEYQRVMIAAALAQQAKILLLDEPTAFLDYQHQDEVIDLINKLNSKQATTIVLVTHDINTALLTCDDVLALDNGVNAFTGKTSELLLQNRLETIFHTSFRLLDDPATGRKIIAPREGAGK